MVSKTVVAALVLMVAVPTMLGYALAFNEEIYTAWESSDRVNVTDSLLNSETPYFIPSASTMNNSQLHVKMPNDYLYLRAPDYVNISDTASSYPIYTPTTSTIAASYTYDEYTTSGTTVSGSGTYIAFNEGIQPAGIAGSIYITTTSSATLTYIGGTYTGTAFGPFIQTAADRWTWGSVVCGNNPDTFLIESSGANSYTVKYGTWEQINYAGDLSMTIPYAVNIKIDYSNSNTDGYYLSTAASNTITKSSDGTLKINNNYTQYNVSQIFVCSTDATDKPSFTVYQSGWAEYHVDTTGKYVASMPGGSYFDGYYAINTPVSTTIDPIGVYHISCLGVPVTFAYRVDNAWIPLNLPTPNLYLVSTNQNDWKMYDTYGNQLAFIETRYFNIGINDATYLDDVNVYTANFVDITPANASGGAITTDAYKFWWTYGGSFRTYHSNGTYRYFQQIDAGHTADYVAYTVDNGTLYKDGVQIDTGVTRVDAAYCSYGTINQVSGSYYFSSATHTITPDSFTNTSSGNANTYQKISYGNEMTASDPSDPYGLIIISTSNNSPLTLTHANGTYYAAAGIIGPFVQTSETSWICDDIEVDSTHFTATTLSGETFTIRTFGYTDLSSINEDFTLNSLGAAAFRFVHTDNTVSYWPAWEPRVNPGYVSLAMVGTTAIVNDHAIYNVSSASIAANHTYSYSYTHMARGNTFADVAYGWNLYDASAAWYNVDEYWVNGSDNESIRMMISLENGEETVLTPIGASAASSVTITMLNDNIYVGGLAGQNLGKYSKVQVILTGSGAQISGIKNWPTFGASAKLLNTVSVEFDDQIDMFTKVLITSPYTIEYRVDEASVIGGTFPSIKDNTLNLTEEWPDKSYSILMSSVGVYGDYLVFGDETFNVTDGNIIVDGSRTPLLKAVFSSTYDEDTETWTNSVNNVPYSTGAPSALTFGGEWSATVAAYTMESVEKTEKVWQPGEFAFNGLDNSFALLGLLTAVLVFIALGLYGRRSGAKVGTLMLVCGACAAVFLCLIV